MASTFVRIPAFEREYPVIIGPGAIAELPQLSKTLAPVEGLYVLFDENVRMLAERIQSILPGCSLIPVPSGESSKSLSEVQRILRKLFENGASRQSLIINIGGGMITDLGGFIASIYMRGIRCIHVPTTLLGMVDASIGGKTGVDLDEAKNIVGHYHHPSAVVEDTDFLSSLPSHRFQEGLVEIVKVAAMLDAAFFAFLEESIEGLLRQDRKLVEQCIMRAVELKASVVGEDERDSGRRMYLNFGHTVGHALEAASAFEISHGEAVSMGMVAEMEAVQSQALDPVRGILRQVGMPVENPEKYGVKVLMPFMRRDKKNTGSVFRFAVPRALGEGTLLDVDPNTLKLR